MSRIQTEFIPCPFCDKGQIECGYVPGAWSHKMKRTKTLPGSGSVIKSSDVWLIKTGCSVCGKTAEEVEKELKKQGVI